MAQPQIRLNRFDGNPILKPCSDHEWESKAVFNPAAIYLNDTVHLLYRAIGYRDTSVLGYAASYDGVYFHERLPEPVYVPRESFEGVSPAVYRSTTHSGMYVSGGGERGGCEDPRLTCIGDTVYMAYVAFDGSTEPRVALSSINREDFLAKRWDWKKPVLMSPPGIIDKSPAIFPEKIHGKFVIFHRVYPNLLIDYVDDLEFGEGRWLKGEYSISPDLDCWDSRKIGTGAPPLKTKDGWLLIYNAVDDDDPGNYKVGAMLLDMKDEPRVIARLAEPLFEPETVYENEGWKSGVVYPCGAVIIGDDLFVYYGAADYTVCIASISMTRLLNGLRETTLPNK